MKRQNNLASNGSVRGIVAATILSTMLCTSYVNANNRSSSALNALTDGIETENKIENWMTSNTYWGANIEMTEDELNNSVAQWMGSSSYWVGEKEIIDEAENLSQIEPWMISNSYWGGSEALVNVEEKLPVEAWMSSTSYWLNGDSNIDQILDQCDKTASKCLSDSKCNL